MKNFIKIIFVVFAFLMIVGCSNDFREIPAGYVGKILMPTGWEEGIREAGQVDIKPKSSDGSYSTLVLLEATSVALKENFGQAKDGDKEDHRILVGKTPVTVDVYVRLLVPVKAKQRNAIFAQITPIARKGQDRVSEITVKKIYTQFAAMDIRSGVRAILQKKDSIYAITKNLDSVNAEIGRMAVKVFKKNGVPLLVQNVTVSNVKMDESIWKAENEKSAALAQVDAIEQIGKALSRNPKYLIFKKYETLEKIAKTGKVGTFTIIEGNPGGIVVGQ